MVARGYKKYMKKDVRQGHPLLKIFVMSFFGMLLLSTFIINSFAKKMTVDTSIGDYKEQAVMDELDDKKVVDNRLTMIRDEDQNKTFSDLMKGADENSSKPVNNNEYEYSSAQQNPINQQPEKTAPSLDTVYKVYIGTYTSAEQAKAANEIIKELGNGFSPIVKCLGANNYTLQAGTFKNKQSAETLLMSINNSNLPGRIVQEN